MLNSIPHLTKKSQDDSLKKIQDGSPNPEIASLRSQRRGWGGNPSFSLHPEFLPIFSLRDPLQFTVARGFSPYREALSPSSSQGTFPLAIASHSSSRHREAVSLWSLRTSFLLVSARPCPSLHRKDFPLLSVRGLRPLVIARVFPLLIARVFPLLIARTFPSRHCEARSAEAI